MTVATRYVDAGWLSTATSWDFSSSGAGGGVARSPRGGVAGDEDAGAREGARRMVKRVLFRSKAMLASSRIASTDADGANESSQSVA